MDKCNSCLKSEQVNCAEWHQLHFNPEGKLIYCEEYCPAWPSAALLIVAIFLASMFLDTSNALFWGGVIMCILSLALLYYAHGGTLVDWMRKRKQKSRQKAKHMKEKMPDGAVTPPSEVDG